MQLDSILNTQMEPLKMNRRRSCRRLLGILFLGSLMALALSPETASAQNVKKLLRDLPAVQRDGLIREVQVFRTDSPPQDLAKFLSETCGFEYLRNSAGEIQRPQINCKYKAKSADKPFGGSMAKFQCEFESETRGKFTAKVKYDDKKRAGGGSKEIPQAIIGTLLARSMGFEGNIFCPADVTCLNCPSDHPWSLQRSQVAPVEGQKYEFKNIIFEVKDAGDDILLTNPSMPFHPTGFLFDKDLMAKLPSDKELMKSARIDREALAIWDNFYLHFDAGAYNMMLGCRNPELNSKNEIGCQQVIAYINDYGDGFGYNGNKAKMSVRKFLSAGPVVPAFGGFKTAGSRGSSNPAGIRVSPEGIRRFVQVFEQVSQEQLKDILDLSQIEIVSDSSRDQWLKAIEEKKNLLKELRP